MQWCQKNPKIPEYVLEHDMKIKLYQQSDCQEQSAANSKGRRAAMA